MTLTSAPAPAHPVARSVGQVTWPPRRWLAELRDRLSERSFWVIQAGILLVTAAHWVAELAIEHRHGGLLGSLVFVPVILYVVPVAYAALRYGFEGGVLTGVWAAVLAVPNMVLIHGDDFEWVGELLLITLIVGLGAVVALPVERERHHRARAEQASTTAAAASQRLALLSEIAALSVHTEQLPRELGRVLHHLIEILDLSAAAVVVRTTGTAEVRIELGCGQTHRLHHLLQRIPHGSERRPGLLHLDDGAATLPLSNDAEEERTLLVTGTQVPALTPRDEELLETIAIQVAAAFETVRLQHQQQQRWRLYLRHTTRAQEDERRRLARDLHDVAVHELLLQRRRVREATEEPTVPREVAASLAEVHHGLGTLTEQLRRFGGALRPSVLTHLGLTAALQWLATEVSQRAQLRVEVKVEGTARRLTNDDELALFRVAEEALRNAERHAQASTVVIQLEFGHAAVSLEVIDDGIGFTVPGALEDLAQHSRLGLLGMRERAELSGGHLRIASEPSGGTRISMHLPDTDLASPDLGHVRTHLGGGRDVWP